MYGVYLVPFCVVFSIISIDWEFDTENYFYSASVGFTSSKLLNLSYLVRRMTQKLPTAVHKKIEISMRWFSYENDATILESRSTLVLRSPQRCSRTGNSSKLPRNLSAKAQSSNWPNTAAHLPGPLLIILSCFLKNDNTHDQKDKNSIINSQQPM